MMSMNLLVVLEKCKIHNRFIGFLCGSSKSELIFLYGNKSL